jgi:hypothetical protein
MVPIATVPLFTLCIHLPFFLYSGPYITTTFDHLPARASFIYISLRVPFFYRKILSVMIHHWITLVIRMFFPHTFWLDTKEN